MSQHDCCEPWYQCDTFTYGDAVAALTYCLKGKIEDSKMLEALIKETVSEKTDFDQVEDITHSCTQNIRTIFWRDSNT